MKDPVSKERIRGIRIFDISDIAHPKNVANVQTCRGSHTHTRARRSEGPERRLRVRLRFGRRPRSPSELAGCIDASPEKDPNSALFRIEVIKVPLAHPEQAAIVSSPRIFNDLAAPPTPRRSAGRHRASIDAATRARRRSSSNVDRPGHGAPAAVRRSRCSTAS